MEDRSWYKSCCKLCPYFVNDESLQKLHCVRPVGEGCLAESLLVAGIMIADAHNARVTKMNADRDKREADHAVVEKLSDKRRRKLVKRRR